MNTPVMPRPDLDLAARLFDTLYRNSFDGVGITRDTYGSGEQRAHDLIAATARELDLETAQDAALNLYVTLPGRDRDAPRAMTGSHLDSVPAGGNFDGAAGVIAGISVLAGWRRAGYVPSRDVVVMGVRAEESTWFPYSYLGSKAAFGKVARSILELKRSDTQRSLGEHLTECGGSPEQFGRAYLEPGRIARFIELHIEQGPVLVEAGIAIGIVTGIRGSFRYRDARAVGAYAHSGAVPRRNRRDAVRAAALLITALDEDWRRLEEGGRDLAITIGKLSTNPAQHAFSKVAGEIDICIDVRSLEARTLGEVDALLAQRVREIGAATNVSIVLGERSGSDPALMDATIQSEMGAAAKRRGIATRMMASGAGHDSAVFAQMGVPTGMIFVRNDFGSHNPDERMEMADFELGAVLLADMLSK